MVNINKLKGKIVEKGFTVEKLAKEMDLDRSTLYRKLSNDGETLLIREANMICKALQLTGEEATAIFFSRYVA